MVIIEQITFISIGSYVTNVSHELSVEKRRSIQVAVLLIFLSMMFVF
jgi:hypothetical protein